jgi:acetoin utilization deacetylase AcuC-like enzyme
MRHRTAILRSTAFLQHDTGDHPERASRIIAIDCELERRHLIAARPTVMASPASDEAILRVHSQELLDGLRKVAAAGGAWIDGDTVVRRDSLDVARLAAGAAVNAVEAIRAKQIDRAFLIARPPGHHATPTRAMGFCLLNTVAIAAAHALDTGSKRIAILDWDVHHGNGTQDIFYGRSDVLYLSLHQSPLFPGTGVAAETGTGEGEGFTLNIPLEAGATDDSYLRHLRDTVIPAIDEYGPDFLILSAGYDAHVEDPIGGMAVTDAGFQQMMREIVPVANRNGGALLAVLEGGYNSQALARCVGDAIEILDEIPLDSLSAIDGQPVHEQEKSRII